MGADGHIELVCGSPIERPALRKHDGGYHEEVIKSGIVRSTAMLHFWLDLAWLFNEPRPTMRKALESIESNSAL